MPNKIRGAAPAVKPTEYELTTHKKTGNVALRAYHPVTGKKYTVLQITNGGAGDIGKIQLHPRNSGLGLTVDRNGYPVTSLATV